MNDKINPNHYKSGIVECIDAIESATINKSGLEAVCVANVIKYLWRYENKNGLEDIKKAQWYLQKLIKHYTDEQIRKNQQPYKSLASVSERGNENQEGFQESSLQEQLRKPIQHTGCDCSGTIELRSRVDESPTRRVTYYYHIPCRQRRVYGEQLSTNSKRPEQSPADRFCY